MPASSRWDLIQRLKGSRVETISTVER